MNEKEASWTITPEWECPNCHAINAGHRELCRLCLYDSNCPQFESYRQMRQCSRCPAVIAWQLRQFGSARIASLLMRDIVNIAASACTTRIAGNFPGTTHYRRGMGYQRMRNERATNFRRYSGTETASRLLNDAQGSSRNDRRWAATHSCAD